MGQKGQKTAYTPERVRIICDAIERGEMDKTAARLAGVRPQTICEWKQRHPEFAEAVKRAEEAFLEWQNSELLAEAKKSLKTLICGTVYEEVRIEEEPTAQGYMIKRKTRTQKHVAPNPAAIIFALTNRDPENWQNRLNSEVRGRIETDGAASLPLASIPDELLEKVIEAMGKDGHGADHPAES